VALVVGLVAGVGSAVAAVGGWSGGTVPALTGGLYSVSCPNTRTCWAWGYAPLSTSAWEGELLRSSDGGRRWVRASHRTQSAAGPGFGFGGVACATGADCWALGERFPSADVLATTNAGRSWHVQAIPRLLTLTSSDSIACPTSSHCWVVGQARSNGRLIVVATADGGTEWQAQHLPPVTGWPLAIACPTDGDCWIIGETVGGGDFAFHTSDGGARWDLETLPATQGQPNAISCVPSGACWILAPAIGGSDLLSTRTGGHSWERQFVAIPGLLTSIACVPRSTDCWATGYGDTSHYGFSPTDSLIVDTHDGGRHWSVQSDSPLSAGSRIGGGEAISCPAANDCVVVGINPENARAYGFAAYLR
jgi:photosystem II stability/assembly factor-like uncharacterized protein